MTKVYAMTPAVSRVREGAYGEAILPENAQPGPVYVYDAAVRAWHWVTALCIFVLAVTGPPALGTRSGVLGAIALAQKA